MSCPWKDKILDYEIETWSNSSLPLLLCFTWKDKILDYEIETVVVFLGAGVVIPWKDKILDYEIETTLIFQEGVLWYFWLEKIRFSITRLKLCWRCLYVRRRWAWKDKILDYEIETWKLIVNPRPVATWKDKILDYEIETTEIYVSLPAAHFLKR